MIRPLPDWQSVIDILTARVPGYCAVRPKKVVP
jgi:hypothetical protein